MGVILRNKDQGKGKIYLHLEYNLPGEKRKRKSTGLYLFSKPKNQTERQHNREVKELAEAIKSKAIIQIKNREFDFKDDTYQKLNFYKFLEDLLRRKSNSLGNLGNWKSMIKHLQTFHKGDLLFKDINQTFVEGFKDYLDRKHIARNEKKLSQNSKQSYFAKFKAALKEAVKQEIIAKDPSSNIQGFKDGDTQREYLTIEELRKLNKKDCNIPKLKEAFLFACYTGLRWSDIEKLTWNEIINLKSDSAHLKLKISKTDRYQIIPLAEGAKSILENISKEEAKVFHPLTYSQVSTKLQDWIDSTKINKKITFHCARHTNATWQITTGTDLYTVKSNLGHKHIKTTEIYSKVIDEKKKEAIEKLKL